MPSRPTQSPTQKRVKVVAVVLIVVVMIGVLLASFGGSSGPPVDKSGQAGCKAFTSAMNNAQASTAAQEEVAAAVQGASVDFTRSTDPGLVAAGAKFTDDVGSNASDTALSADAQALANQCAADGF